MARAAIRELDCRRPHRRFLRRRHRRFLGRWAEGLGRAIPCLVVVWALAPVRARVMAVPRAMAPPVTVDWGAVAQQHRGRREARHRSR